MEITEVRIKLMENSDDRLQAFCSITFDNSFVIRDLKVIDGTSGPFVAMPSRKLTAHCHNCGSKNHLRAGFCNHCGSRLREDRTQRDPEGRNKLYADIAHPINSLCREMIQTRVIAEFQAELEKAKHPNYVSRYDEEYGFDAGEDYTPPEEKREAHAPETRRADTRIDAPHADAPTNPPHHAPDSTTKPNAATGPHSKPNRPRNEFGAGIFE